MKLDNFVGLFRPAIEKDLKSVIADNLEGQQPEFMGMVNYHMGWEGEGAGEEAEGKRIRPLLLLLTVSAAGGDWCRSLPAATAVELVHNFSLIHDDIQDNSTMRRGRPTVWFKWGVAQAINAGDLLFTLAYISLNREKVSLDSDAVVESVNVLSRGCARLTRGQFLDLDFEKRGLVSLDAYFQMIDGKTAALLSVCTELGAISAGVEASRRILFQEFGYNLGMAFQIIDDWLGIWGDSAFTGKSTQSDLIARKKTLPVVYMLKSSEEFVELWNKPTILPADLPALLKLMEQGHAMDYVLSEADRFSSIAMDKLEKCSGSNEAADALRYLTKQLLARNK
jgi:geranylgeranyl diphosphate synthase, type I